MPVREPSPRHPFFAAAAIVALLGALSIGLWIYSNKTKNLLQNEKDKAVRLGWASEIGWELRPLPDVPVFTPEHRAVADLENEAAHLLPMGLYSSFAARLDRLSDTESLKATDAAATLLHEKIAVLRPQHPNFDLDRPSPVHLNLVHALLKRADISTKQGKFDQAHREIETAAALATILAGANVAESVDASGRVLAQWCHTELGSEAETKIPDMAELYEYGVKITKQSLGLRVSTAVESRVRDGRELYRAYRFGNDVAEQLARARTREDLIKVWADSFTVPFHHSCEPDWPKMTKLFRMQIFQEQLRDLFLVALLKPDELERRLASSSDPFNPGHPLRYSKSPDGFAIYSIGRNGVDEGGADGDLGITVHDRRVVLRLKA